MDEIIWAATQRGGRSIIYDGFSYRLDRAGYKFIEWRCTNTKSTESVVKATDVLTQAVEGKIQVSLQVNAQNICTQSMSRISEIYRSSCADLMAFFADMLRVTVLPCH